MNFHELNKLVINLPERTDRLSQLKKELVYLPCSNLQIVSGIKNPNAWKGIAQAHLNCILIAKQNDWDNVLIMEDDLCLQGKEETYDYLLNCLENLPENWDILLGGVYFSQNLKPFNKFWNSVGEFCGLHFYIVNKKAYDKILEYDFKQHIDRWMNQKGRLNCYVTSKFIATQYGGFSDNTNSKVDYKSKLKKYKVL